MIVIRLSRKGATNNAFYRIVALEQHSKRDGKVLEVLGYWHAPKNVKNIEKDKIKAWVARGAKVSDAVSKLLV